jgi:predicted nucleic acid-binding protein
MLISKVYWDTSCFISFLSTTHPQEAARADICEDVLKHARAGDVQIWTSAWTIVETIRPKEQYKPTPLPAWAAALDVKDAAGNLIWPNAKAHLETIWNYHDRNTVATRNVSPSDAAKLKGMFAWPWIFKIQVVPTIAEHAADIARAHNMKAADSLHVASALATSCEVIHRWDRDYRKTDGLIPSKSPERMSPQNALGLTPSEF